MIIGFSKYGTGSGKKAVNYCIDESRPGREHNPPEVLRGNPEYTTELIDSLDFKYKYTSGVLSFAPGETITPEMEEAIMDRFEDTAFAGLSRDQYSIMWVRHSHAGHHELHFITPRVELSTGKSLNIRPPGKETQKLFDALRSEINARYGLADPDDPARARNVRIPDYELKIAAEKLRNGQEPEADIRKLLDDLFTQRAAHGMIKNRSDLVEQVSELGFEVARQGKNYITVLEPESGKRWRLKGQLYEQEFNAERAIEAAGRIGTARNRGSAQRSAEEYRQRVEAYCANRKEYNQQRYRRTEREFENGNRREAERTHGLDEGADQRRISGTEKTINATENTNYSSQSYTPRMDTGRNNDSAIYFRLPYENLASVPDRREPERNSTTRRNTEQAERQNMGDNVSGIQRRSIPDTTERFDSGNKMENRWTSGNKNYRGVDEDDRIRKTFIARFESYAGAIRDAILRFRTMAERNAERIREYCREQPDITETSKRIRATGKELDIAIIGIQKTLSVEQMIFKKRETAKALHQAMQREAEARAYFEQKERERIAQEQRFQPRPNRGPSMGR